MLGAPIGTQQYVVRQLKAKSTEHAVLLDSRCGSRPSSLVFAHLPWFDPCELQFEDGQTTAGAAVCGERRRERWAMSATGSLHRRGGRQNKVGHNTSVLAWKSGFGKCTQNRRSRTSGDFGGLSRYDPQPPRHRQTVQSTVSRRFGFVNESWESESSQFSLWNRWLTAHDISWRTRMSRVNPD